MAWASNPLRGFSAAAGSVITLRENYELLDDFYCRFALILAHIHSRLNVALSIYSAMSDYSKLRSYHTTYTTVNYIFIPLLIFLPACNSNDRINELLCRAEYHYNTLGADEAIATVREIDDKHEYVIDSNVARFLLLWGEKEQRIEDFDHANFIFNSMKSLPDDPDEISARYISDAGLFPLCGYQLRYS